MYLSYNAKKRFEKALCSIAAAVLLSTGSLLAQGAEQPAQTMPAPATEVSDDELEKVLAVNKQMKAVQEDIIKKMDQIVEKQGLTPERYEAIVRSQMEKKKSDATEEEMQKAQAASTQIQGLQRQLHTQGAKAIKDAGLTPQQYQQIGMAIQQNANLQKRYKKLTEAESK